MTKLEVLACPDLYAGVDNLVEKMEALNVNTSDGSSICIVVKSTGEVKEGKGLFNAFAFINATDSEIIDELDGN